MGNVVYILWIVALCLIVDAHKHHQPQKPDWRSIVDAIRKDVDQHINKMSAAAGKHAELPFPTKSEHLNPLVEDTDSFFKSLKEAMDHHLVRNLGHPSDAGSSTRSTTEGYTKDSPSTAGPTSRASTTQSASSYPVTPPSKGTTGSGHTHEPPKRGYPVRVGSMKGIPGVNFPDYTDIPITSFACSGKTYLPGFYADLDTGCQVFHVCWPDRRESFLCPMGTIFNQALLACDYWYSTNCSLAPHYYNVNAETDDPDESLAEENESSMISFLLAKASAESSVKHDSSEIRSMASASVMSFISQFVPVKAKVVIYPGATGRHSKVVASASIGGEKKGASYKAKSLKKPQVSRKRQHVPTHPFQPLLSDDPEQFVLVNGKPVEVSELEMRIFQRRINEALDGIVEDMESNNSTLKFYPNVKEVVEFFKRFFGSSVAYEPPPGSELYEYDLSQKKVYGDLRQFTTSVLTQLAARWDERQRIAEVHKPDSLKSAPLTALNPRFIIKPAEEPKVEVEKHVEQPVSSKKEKTIKRPIIRELPLKSKPVPHGLTISSRTKKSLLINYMKLFKLKVKNA